MSELRFSIVIPAYNYAEVLPRAVASACSQAGDDYEVLVIDDGSTDDTPRVLGELEQQYPKLRTIRQSNSGPAGVRNRGVDETQGHFLIFLDADDELLPDALALFRACSLRDSQADFLIAPTVSVFADGREVQGVTPVVSDVAEQRFLDYLYKRLRLSNGAVAMSRELFNRVRYNPELRQTEDLPVFAQCLVLGRCAVIGEATTRIHKHDDSLRHNVDSGLGVGMSLVDEIFNPRILSEQLMRHRDLYRARRALSLFRLCYRGRQFAKARTFFAQAWKADRREVLAKPENLLKFARCLLSSSR